MTNTNSQKKTVSTIPQRILHIISFVGNVANRIGEILSILSFIGLLISIFLQVICRFLLGFSLMWSEEIGRYLMIFLSYVIFGVLGKEGGILKVEFVVDRLPRKLARVVRVLADAGSLFFLCSMCYFGFKLVRFTMGSTTVVTGIPKGYIYLCIPVGFALYLLSLIKDLGRNWGEPKKLDKGC